MVTASPGAAGQRRLGWEEMEPDPRTWALRPLNELPVRGAGLFYSCSARRRAVPALPLAGCVLSHIPLLTSSLAKAAFAALCQIEGSAPVQLLFSVRKERGLSGPFWLCQGLLCPKHFHEKTPS